MRTLVFVLILVTAAAGCREKTRAFLEEPTDTRAPIATHYVTGPELPVYQRPDETSPVLITYQNGESVPVLAQQGEWTEIRTGDRSGWARSANLGTSQQAVIEDNMVARFVKAPASVTNLTARGEIYIEADVNTDGDVVNTRIITNSTGSEELAQQNAAALRTAKFYPIVKGGERQVFQSYHRVTY